MEMSHNRERGTVMARAIFVAHDVRLLGRTPTKYTRMNVGETIALGHFVQQFKNWAENATRTDPDFEVTLQLMAHGRPGLLQFCKEWIQLGTIQQLRPLNPYVYLIECY